MKSVLIIGGSDSSAGAGIQADLKTAAALGVYGLTVITSVTAQDRGGVRDRQDIPGRSIAAQIDAAVAVGDIAAAKIGMLGTTSAAEVVLDRLRAHKIPNLVLDPIVAAEAGGSLADDGLSELILARLAMFVLIKPNIFEAARLTNRRIETPADMENAAAELFRMGARSVLLTGGHMRGDEVVDILIDKNGPHRLASPRLTATAHGTGCTLTTAVAGFLALGRPLDEAVESGRRFVHEAIKDAIHLKNNWTVANQLFGIQASRSI